MPFTGASFSASFFLASGAAFLAGALEICFGADSFSSDAYEDDVSFLVGAYFFEFLSFAEAAALFVRADPLVIAFSSVGFSSFFLSSYTDLLVLGATAGFLLFVLVS